MAKGFLISDIHIGAHAIDEDKWLNIIKEYFFDFLIPNLEEKFKEGDTLFILGDLFDNRTSLTIKSICYALDIFNKLEELGIHIEMFLGNHDMYNESSYEYHSMRLFEKYSNINIHTEPKTLKIDDKKILMLPWVTSLNKEHELLREYSGKVDYLFTHSDLRGAKTNLKVSLKHGPSIAEFVGFPKVYAGHIHLHQKIDHFTFLGSPYHLDRNDKGNQKGLTILDIPTGEEEFIPNTLSPEYKTIKITEESDIDSLDNVEEKDNFIDIEISNNLIINKPEIRKKLEQLSKRKRISIKQVDDITIEDTVEDINLDAIGIDISVEDMIRQYVKNQQYDEGLKNKIEIELEEVIKICKDNI